MTTTPEGLLEGLLLVDKPSGWTSHDVVARIRRVCGTRRVGHAGTLDPMATGVLVLGVGRATKLLTFLVGCDKGYAATVRLGESTVTDDAEGDVVASADASDVSRAAIDAAVAGLTGAIQQVPSSVSAIKIDGQRSYARVRSGEDVKLAARPVTVSRFAVLDVRTAGTGLDVDIEVEVSSGTYVRALARDLGSALGVGGHLTALRRTRVGRYAIADAVPLESLEPGGPVPLVSMGDAARAQFAAARADRRGGHSGRPRPTHTDRHVRASPSSRPSDPTGRSSPCSTSPAPRRGRSSSSRPADLSGLPGDQQVAVDARVHAVGEPPVRPVVADLQAGAGTQGRKIGAAEPVGVPGDPDRTAGAQHRDPHGQGVLEQLGRAAVPPASRPAAAVRDAVRARP